MLSTLKESSKTRKEYIAKLFGHLNKSIPAFLGATVTEAPNDAKIIKIVK